MVESLRPSPQQSTSNRLPISDRMGLAFERVPSEQYDMSITTTVEGGSIVQPLALWEALKDFDGMAGDLPADLAANVDHYVHGI